MRTVGIIIAVVLAAIAFSGCGSSTSAPEKQRIQAVHDRAEAFQRAVDKVPVPLTENFPLRSMLAEMTKREDLVNHPWYVYVLAETGNVIGYYVAKTVPINACDFLSSTEDVSRQGDNQSLVLTAPSLDGIFYGGAGSSGGCDVFVFQDQSSGAIIKLGGVKFFVADKPLSLKAEAITVE